ncbi:YjbH domain-containing protein, partial [Gammaproteobacteria bacterium]|nr:YjbH domain-containing protein [Gammaproteobacteria bacterium]
MQTPSAESRDEGTIAFTFNRNDIWKLGTLTVSPFDWLEASYFYYRPSDLTWGGVPGLYLDKGFIVKFVYESKNKNIPNLAIGLEDFAGTGFFDREYLVASHKYRNTKLSLGLGWGKFTGVNEYKNPLAVLSDSFNFRP